MTHDNMELSEQETHNLNLYPVKLEREEDFKYDINCFINVKDELFEVTETVINGKIIQNNDFTNLQTCNESNLDDQIISAYLDHEQKKSKFERKGSPNADTLFKYKCAFCCKKFPDKESYNNHVMCHTNLLVSWTHNKHPGNNQNLHRQNVHTDNSETLISKESKDILTNKQIERYQINKLVEGNNFNSFKLNSDVFNIKENKVKDIPQIVETEGQLAGVVKGTESKDVLNPVGTIFMCDHCKLHFYSKFDLQEHISVHNYEIVSPKCNLPCQYIELLEDDENMCKFGNDLKSEIHAHCTTVNGKIQIGKKTFNCKVCHKSISRKSDLKKHLRTHTGEKPFNCEVCHKSFSDRSNFKKHLKTHTREKPFYCEVCHKSFSSSNYLKKHLKTHTGEKPFNCEVCHKSFSQNADLTKHFRTHTGERPFNCDVCPKLFSRKSTLKRHLRTHTGEKQFYCEVCHKSLAHKVYLKIHLRIHTKEKSFNL